MKKGKDGGENQKVDLVGRASSVAATGTPYSAVQ